MPKPRNNGLSWVKKSEPKFIREFKERIAYKEQQTLAAKTKKPASNEERPDLVTEEKEEDKPQIVQLKSGDLGEKEYNDLRDKEVIANSFASRGKILFKRPTKKTDGESSSEQPCTSDSTVQQEKIAAELDSIFELNKKEDEEGKEEEKEKEETETKAAPEKKKIYLDDEEKAVKEGLSQPSAKRTRLVDRLAEGKVSNSLSAAKVLAREAKAGNRKLLSFYDEEEEENEDYRQECEKEESAKREAEQGSDSDD